MRAALTEPIFGSTKRTSRTRAVLTHGLVGEDLYRDLRSRPAALREGRWWDSLVTVKREESEA